MASSITGLMGLTTTPFLPPKPIQPPWIHRGSLVSISIRMLSSISFTHLCKRDWIMNTYVSYDYVNHYIECNFIYKRLGSCAFDQIIALVTSFLLFHSYHSWKYRNEWSSTCRAAWSSTATASPKHPLEPYEVHTNWVIGGLSQRVPPSCVPDDMF